MGRNEDLSTEDLRLDALVKSEYKKHIAEKAYIEEAEEIIRHAEENVEDFPDDEEDQRRRFLEIMKKMRAQGQLTKEEEEQIFGDKADESDERNNWGAEEISEELSEVFEETASRNDETKEHRDAGEQKVIQKAGKAPRWKLFGRTMGKWAAIVALTGVGMFALTMTSRANRQYVADSVSYILGKDTRVSVNNDDGALIRAGTESEARVDITECIGVSVPVLKYKPLGLMFSGYECYADYGYAIMHYQLDENEMILYISNNDNKKSRTVLYDGKVLEEIEMAVETTTAFVYKSTDDDDVPSYGAEWKYRDAYYRLTGKSEKEEFEKIIKKIWY